MLAHKDDYRRRDTVDFARPDISFELCRANEHSWMSTRPDDLKCEVLVTYVCHSGSGPCYARMPVSLP
jgi:hypothetical protein